MSEPGASYIATKLHKATSATPSVDVKLGDKSHFGSLCVTHFYDGKEQSKAKTEIDRCKA